MPTLGITADSYTNPIVLASPFPLVPWHAAYWASDPSWSHPADGGAVTGWRDGSGNLRDLVVSGGPIYRANSSALNNLPAVQFDGVNDVAVTAAFTRVPQPISHVIVAKVDAVNRQQIWLSSTDAAGYGTNTGNTADAKWLVSGSSPASGGMADTSRHILMSYWLTSSTNLKVDGKLISGAGGWIANDGADKWRLGSHAFSSNYFSGSIAFAGFKAGALTAQEQADMLAWSQNTYNTPWTPADLGTALQMWYDASDLATITDAGAGAVSAWNDKSTYLRHISNGIAANRPLTGTRTINGKNTVDFDGVNDALPGSTVVVPQPLTIYAVAAADSGGVDNGRIIGRGANNAFNFGCNVGSVYMNCIAGFTGPPIDTAPHLLKGIANGASSELSVDGGTPVVGSPGANGFASNPVSVGSRNDGSVCWDGPIGEIVVVSGLLTSGDDGKMKNYLKTKWGTP